MYMTWVLSDFSKVFHVFGRSLEVTSQYPCVGHGYSKKNGESKQRTLTCLVFSFFFFTL